ncbi:AidA/PixA family protein [Azospirillum endophyticum]
MMAAPQPIDVLVVIDTDALLEDPSNGGRTADSPMTVDPALVTTIVRQPHNGHVHIDGKPTIIGTSASTLHVRLIGLGALGEGCILPYRAKAAGASKTLLKFRKSKTKTLNTPLPTLENPEKPAFQAVSHHYWSAAIGGEGQADCDILFMIADRDGANLGHFRVTTMLTIQSAKGEDPQPPPDGCPADPTR